MANSNTIMSRVIDADLNYGFLVRHSIDSASYRNIEAERLLQTWRNAKDEYSRINLLRTKHVFYKFQRLTILRAFMNGSSVFVRSPDTNKFDFLHLCMMRYKPQKKDKLHRPDGECHWKWRWKSLTYIVLAPLVHVDILRNVPTIQTEDSAIPSFSISDSDKIRIQLSHANDTDRLTSLLDELLSTGLITTNEYQESLENLSVIEY